MQPHEEGRKCGADERHYVLIYILGFPGTAGTPFSLAKNAKLPKDEVEETHRTVLRSFSTVESQWFSSLKYRCDTVPVS